MSYIENLKIISDEIKKLKKQIVILQEQKNKIIKEFYKKNKTKILKYTPFKNNSTVLLTKNDIECENGLNDSPYEISSEDSSETEE